MGLQIVGRIHSYEEIVPWFPTVNGVVTPLVKEIVLNGYKIKTDSIRYQCFFANRRCFACGLTGTFFKVQRENNHPPDRAHINMYGDDPVIKSKHILFTKDHITPKSGGGANTLSNLVTMCHVCNGNKSNSCVGRDPLAIIKIREDRLLEQLEKENRVLSSEGYWSKTRSSKIQKRIEKRDLIQGYVNFLARRRAELIR